MLTNKLGVNCSISEWSAVDGIQKRLDRDPLDREVLVGCHDPVAPSLKLPRPQEDRGPGVLVPKYIIPYTHYAVQPSWKSKWQLNDKTAPKLVGQQI